MALNATNLRHHARPLATAGTTALRRCLGSIGSLPTDVTNSCTAQRANASWLRIQHDRRTFTSATSSNISSAKFKTEIANKWLRIPQRRTFASSATTTTSTTSTDATEVIRPKVKPRYYIPRSERTTPNSIFTFDPVFKDRLYKVDRHCPTRELNFTPDDWARHKSPWRRPRHMLSLFHSSPFRRLIVPDLAVTATVGACLTYFNELVSPAAPLVIDGGAMAGATTAVGLLAAFRLNGSYGRWDEARKFWGEINNCSRDLAGNACMWLDSREDRERMLKLARAFPYALNFHLNVKGGHYMMTRKGNPDFEEQKYAEFYAEINDIYQDETNEDFVQICNTYYNGGHAPLAISAMMRLIIAQNDTADPIYNREMDEQVQRLVGRLGMCERLLRTPIPTCFTRHTSRLFFIWSNLLPFAMYSSLGPFGVIPGSMLVSYSILAIGDIGVQLEEPFNILPLRVYSDVISDGINGIEASYNLAYERSDKSAARATTSMVNGGATRTNGLVVGERERRPANGDAVSSLNGRTKVGSFV